jgi:hypothetical protein
MSNVDTILDKSTSEAYYDPSMDFSGLMPEGMYKAHATDLVIKENIVIKNKYISDIYEVKFEIAPENKENTYEDNGSEGRYFLPNVNESDVAGMPVEIEVKHNEWTNSEGEKVKTPKAVAIFRWEGQAKKDLTEDLPF